MILLKKLYYGYDHYIRTTQREWTSDQDEFITEHSIEESMEHFKRSKQSIKTRLWRLKKDK